MNKEVKELWLAAMENGQYEYGSGSYKEHTNPNDRDTPCCFCALGVLEDLNPETSWRWSETFDEYVPLDPGKTNNAYDVTEKTKVWAGLSEFQLAQVIKHSDLGEKKGHGFTGVIKYIEENL